MPQPAYPAWAQPSNPQPMLSRFFAPPAAAMPQPMPAQQPQAQPYLQQAQYLRQMQQFQQMQQMQQAQQSQQSQQMARMAQFQMQPMQQAPQAMTTGVSQLRCIPVNVDYNRLPVGAQPLYDGRYKTVMPLLMQQTGQLSGHVLVVEKDRNPKITREEVQGLADLQEMGFPVPPIQSTGSYRGHSAKIMPQMLPVHLSHQGLVDSPFATFGTFDSLQRIVALADGHRIGLDTLQLLMNPSDGRVYVSGPAGVNQEIEQFTSESLLSRSSGSESSASGVGGVRESLRGVMEALRQRFGGHGGAR